MTELYTVVMNKDNYKKELMNLLDFDEDFNGNNGLDYVDEEAISDGFDSNNKWFLASAEEMHNDYKKVISEVLNSFDCHPQNECYFIQYSITEIGNQSVVSLMVVNSDSDHI